MIETAFIEQRMRDVNPVPGVDAINDNELSRAVAAAHTRTAALRQAPTQHEAIDPLLPAPRRLRSRRAGAFAGAFAVILAAVGIAALVLRGENLPATNEPAPPATATIPEVATPADREALAIQHGWQRVATVTEQPWIDEINGAAALPGGGFVTATAWSPTVMWSPDGLNWFDGDPRSTIESRTVAIAVVGDQIVVLGVHEGETSPAVLWIGDPTTGSWERMSLDTNRGGVQPGSVSMASNNSAVLLAAELNTPAGNGDAGAGPEIVIWLVDPAARTSNQTTLLIPAGRDYPSPSVEWFDGRWLILVDVERPVAEGGEPVIESSLWTSPDGSAFSEVEIPPEFREQPRLGFIPGRSGIVATTSSGIWFSADGVDWRLLASEETSVGGLYSEALGFVLPSHRVSEDGSMLEPLPLPQQDFFVLAASNGALLGVDGWGPREEHIKVDLWLHRGPGDE